MARLRCAALHWLLATSSPSAFSTCRNSNRLRWSAIGLAIYAFLFSANPTARAAFHLWQIQEVFTNSSGSVQFIELWDNNPGETLMTGMTVTSTVGATTKTFKFPSFPNKNTQMHSVLIATTGFGSLSGGVTPDFLFSQSSTPISGSFFDPNASSVTFTFSGNGDSITVPSATLPKDGIHSVTDTNAQAIVAMPPNLVSTVNSPTNLDGNAGSVDLSTPSPTGDYNGNHLVDAADYAVWRKTLTGSVSPFGSGADGNANGTIDAGDYTFWRARYGNTAGAGALVGEDAPEPLADALLLVALPVIGLYRRRR